jgi:hypothetical protein
MQLKITLKKDEKGTIELFNSEDKLILTKDLFEGENEIDLYKSVPESGTYSYRILVNKQLRDQRKLIVMN